MFWLIYLHFVLLFCDEFTPCTCEFYEVCDRFSAVAVLLSALTLFIGSLNGAQLLHQLLLSNILRVPCTTFFDVTPVGRILNRFSKDVDTLDNILPMTIRGWITCFFSVCV